MKTNRIDEKVIWTGRPAWSRYIFLWFFTVVFAGRMALSLRIGHWGSAMIFGAGAILFIALGLFQHQTTRYRITRKAVYRSKGMMGKDEYRFPLMEIDSASVQGNVLDRLFGTGTLVLNLKGGRIERLDGIIDPEVVSLKLEALLTPLSQAVG